MAPMPKTPEPNPYAAPPPDPTWAVWQLLDSAFPIGGFAHSAGLEASHQGRMLSSSDDLADFLRARLREAGTGPLVFTRYAHEQPTRFRELDQRLDAFLLNQPAHQASTRQGLALISAARRAFAHLDFADLDDATRLGGSPGHLATVMGHVTRRLGVPCDTALRMAAFAELRTVLSAAVRLNLAGPLEAQRLLHDAQADTDQTVAHALSLTLDQVHQSTPLLELVQGQQDRLYSKLFQS